MTITVTYVDRTIKIYPDIKSISFGDTKGNFVTLYKEGSEVTKIAKHDIRSIDYEN